MNQLPLTEQVVSLPIYNPDPPWGTAKGVSFAGKTDRLESIEGDIYRLVDWKTTGSVETTIREKVIGFQPYLYALAWEARGCRVVEIEYRIIVKPGIRFCGKDADRHSYENRCVEWLQQEPESRVVTHTLMLNQSRMKAAKEFLWEAHKRILDSRRHDRWLPNEHACNSWSRVCEYAPLCEAIADGSDVKWLIREGFQVECPHPELGDYQGPDQRILTHSSLSLLTLCEMRYFWRYERGLRKKKDYNEALWMGSAFHVGMEAYAKGGKAKAFTAIDEWEKANPVLGSEVKDRDQQVARIRAMVRVAALKWPIVSEKGQGDGVLIGASSP